MTENKKYPFNFAENKKFCKDCGAELPETARFCLICGALQVDEKMMNVLYGGPEMFGKKAESEEVAEPMNDVYGGPEMSGISDEPEKTDELISGVYAGPEMSGVSGEPDETDEPMTLLYGGPRMFEALYAAPRPKKSVLSKIKEKLEK